MPDEHSRDESPMSEQRQDQKVEKANQSSNEQSSLQQQTSADIASLTPLIGLAEKYFSDAEKEREYRIRELIAHSSYDEKQLERDAQQDVRNHELALKEVDLKKHVYDRTSLIGGLIIFMVFAVAMTLIIRGDIDSGLKVLVYVAVGASLVTGGIGFEKSRQEKKRREELEASYTDEDNED